MTKDMIHDSISTNMEARQYLRLCCCHDKSSFYPLLINIYQWTTWSGDSLRGLQGSTMWYTASWEPHACMQDILILWQTCEHRLLVQWRETSSSWQHEWIMQRASKWPGAGFSCSMLSTVCTNRKLHCIYYIISFWCSNKKLAGKWYMYWS